MTTTSKGTARSGHGQATPKKQSLWDHFHGMIRLWEGAFPQYRTWRRATNLLTALIACEGRSTITNAIGFLGREQADWTADYRIFNTSLWKIRDLFRVVLTEAIKELPPGSPVVVALDDTVLRKVGTKIEQARWCHDALAPKFLEKQICWGIRMLHATVLIPTYLGHRPLAVSVAFEPIPAAPRLKSPEKLTDKEIAAHQAKKKECSLTSKTSGLILWMREVLDKSGHKGRKLLLVVDGSFTNGEIVSALPHDTELVGRFRKNAQLRAPIAQKHGKTIYGDELPTPENYLKDDSIPFKIADCHYGGDMRRIRFKEAKRLYWPQGTRSKLMRMIIVEPIPYIVVGRKKRGYNKPGYLLTTDLLTPAEELVQDYLNRWQIEVMHRDLKSGLGVGQVQAFSVESNDRIHGAQVATYSLLLLAAHRRFQGGRTEDYPELPAWRKGKAPARLSQHELVVILRNELARVRKSFAPATFQKPKGWRLNHRDTYQAA